MHQLPAQSEFIPEKSTEDRTLTSRILTECEWEPRQKLFAAYDDFHNAFSYMHQKVPWSALQLREVSSRLFSPIVATLAFKLPLDMEEQTLPR